MRTQSNTFKTLARVFRAAWRDEIGDHLCAALARAAERELALTDYSGRIFLVGPRNQLTLITDR